MGSQTIIDIIGSAVVFGWLLLMTLGGNQANNENTQTLKGELLVQQNMVEVTRLLEYDFRKIGYCREPNNLPDPTKAIRLADTDRIKFLTDVDNGAGPDGNIDSIYYYVGPKSELVGTPDTNDRFLYRVVNTQPAKGASMGITVFTLKYYDDQGNIIPTPVSTGNLQRIQTIQISLKVENVYGAALSDNALNDQYSPAVWQQMRMSTRNYRNR